MQDKASRCKIHCNRSLAYLKGLRLSEALEDAEAAILCKPDWCKAHWRRGAALKELKRTPDAVSAFHTAWQLSKGAYVLMCSSAAGHQLSIAVAWRTNTHAPAATSFLGNEVQLHCLSYWKHMMVERVMAGSWLAAGTASEEECNKMLWAMIQRLTREQLCQGILAKISELVSQVPSQHQCSITCPAVWWSQYDFLRRQLYSCYTRRTPCFNAEQA